MITHIPLASLKDVNMKTSIVGIIRFSVLSTESNHFKAWKSKIPPTFENWCATVLSEDRLNHRFDLFECLTLPSLASQTDKGFEAHVITTTLLPMKFKDRLNNLLKKYSFLRIHALPPENAEHKVYSAHILPFLETRKAFASFRLDDDDALAADYIGRLRSNISFDKVDHAVTFCRGYSLFIDKAGRSFVGEDAVQTNPSVGMAFISGPKNPKLIFDRTPFHIRIHHKVPTITDGRKVAFAYVNHEWNDTGYESKIEKMDAASAEEILREGGIYVRLSDLSSRWKKN